VRFVERAIAQYFVVHGARRDKYKATNLMSPRRFDQAQRADDVFLGELDDIAFPSLKSLAGQVQCGMHHGITAVDQLVDGLRVAQVTLEPLKPPGNVVQSTAIATRAIPTAQLVAAAYKLPQDVTSNEAGPAGDCDFHEPPLSFRPILAFHSRSRSMRSTLAVLLAAIVSALAMNHFSDRLSAEEKSEKVLRHIVLYKFKDDISKQQVQEVIDAFSGLPKKIDTIIGFEHGENVSPEGKSEGLTYAFMVTFRDEAGRDTYLKHPAHDAYVQVVKDKREKVVVFDYWADHTKAAK
jgi:hypothetical protein